MSCLRIAMWSGPRNISTAMMRAWGNRPDTAVIDEPFYAHYLQSTGMDHPGAAEVIAAGEVDWRRVVTHLTANAPEGRAIYYQKHMTQHLLPHISRDWLSQVVNCFLIRHPQDVITSYVRIRSEPTYEDTGFPQQAEIFDWVCQHTGTIPPVVDSRDVSNHPREILSALCERLGVTFMESMLSWEPGLRPTDGVWAKHWYKEVQTTTGFRPYTPKPDVVPDRLLGIYEQCLVCYDKLYAVRIKPA